MNDSRLAVVRVKRTNGKKLSVHSYNANYELKYNYIFSNRIFLYHGLSVLFYDQYEVGYNSQ